MIDLESEGGKGNYLRVRVQVRIDITKPLNRARKVWSKGSVIGCVILKYECLPKFCYWCGLVSHDDRDCECWLRSKGSLKKSDQNFGDWMRAKIDSLPGKPPLLYLEPDRDIQKTKNLHHIHPQPQTHNHRQPSHVTFHQPQRQSQQLSLS